MSCSAAEIAEKRRLAKERLQKTLGTAHTPKPSTSSNTATSPGTDAKPTSVFYGNGNNEKAETLNQYENKMKHQPSHRTANRISSQPYPVRDGAAAQSTSSTNTNNNARKVASIFEKVISCTCSMISSTRFQVKESGYSAKLIDVYKSIQTRSFDHEKKIWSFDLSVYDEVQKKVRALNPNVSIGPLPNFVLKLLRQEKGDLDFMCLEAIEKKLYSVLLDFQKYGAAFAIRNGGRCMIADDMGLGKTYQAIAVADFYKDDWPLLVVTTATARDNWVRKIEELLPWVPADSIKCLVSMNDYIGDCKVLVTSYSLMDKHADRLVKKHFGFVVLDESHTIKNSKTKTTASAIRICENAKRILLLSGTPALSRPAELFSQLSLIDKKFFGSFKEYSTRYCAGKEGTFGWDSSGSSNLEELNIILQRRFMIRRTKESVSFELGEKSRETILLDSGEVWNTKDKSLQETIENCKEFSADVDKLKGDDRREVLLRLYAESAKLKARAVCSYVKGLVKDKTKFIVFAYHKVMMNALSECLSKLGVDFIRIDGTTKAELRSVYIDRFQKNKACQVAVLSLKACNAAITLTASSLVLFAELDWNPSTLAQCESRAHRIGQKSPVICRYLLAKGTVDDYMWNMVKGKQDVLSKAGIFSEDLSDATHSALTIPNSQSCSDQKIEKYFQATDEDSKENDQSNNNNNNGHKTEETDQKPETESMDYKQMLEDDDDDIAMLELDI